MLHDFCAGNSSCLAKVFRVGCCLNHLDYCATHKNHRMLRKFCIGYSDHKSVSQRPILLLLCAFWSSFWHPLGTPEPPFGHLLDTFWAPWGSLGTLKIQGPPFAHFFVTLRVPKGPRQVLSGDPLGPRNGSRWSKIMPRC